ncbi:MAG TPA: hypothetical protein VF761_17995, partial [Gemmatimonadaceae bacterium]
TAPQGVRGRNSDNTKLREVLGWEPRISLEEGLRRTYAWIYGELAAQPETYTVQPPAPAGVADRARKSAVEEREAPRPHGDKLEGLIPRDGSAHAAEPVATSA